MKVSVIVPVYNVGSYIYQCINSIINQTYSNIEIIIVIDGSTDDSSLICHSLAKNDPRIKVIEQKNSGLVSARKKGLEESSGNYILNVDGDDWIDPNCVEILVNQVKINSVDIVVASYFREFIGNLEVIHQNIKPGVYRLEEYSNKIYPELISMKKLFKHGISTFSWGKLFKRDILNNIQMAVPNEITIGEDTVVTYPAITASNSISIIKDPLYFYRQRANSMLKIAGKPENELNKVKLMINFLERQLTEYTSFNFKDQLKEYLVALSIIRTGGYLNKEMPISGIFNNNIDLNDKNIVLYSSGSFGQQMYKKLKASNHNIAGWIDEDTFESRAYGLPVMPISKVNELKPDLVIIATLDQHVFKKISSNINQCLEESILCIHPSLDNKLITKCARDILGM